METNKAIAKKILAVMEGVGRIEKDKTNSHFGYKYVSDEAIVTAIRAEMIKAKLIIIPNQLNCLKEGDITTLTVEYTLLDADSGESLKGISIGQGQDRTDKGIYKAATGSEKYFLLKTFLIPTGDDPEATNEVTKPHFATYEVDQKAFEAAKKVASPSLDAIIEDKTITPSRSTKPKLDSKIIIIEEANSKEYKPGRFRYGIKDNRGVWFTSFKENHFKIANAAVDTGEEIEILFETSEYQGKPSYVIQDMIADDVVSQ